MVETKEKLTVGSASAKPGELKTGFIKGIELQYNSNADIPVIVANGKERGPILCITSTAHGGEISGIEVIRRIVREEIDLEKLSGALICVPVVNLLAFQFGMQVSPDDLKNINRLFPGNPTGSSTERIANAIFEQAVLKSDYLLDFHGNFDPALPYVSAKDVFAKDDETKKKAIEMADAVGLTMFFPNLERFPQPGTVTGEAMSKGIPANTIELPYYRRIIHEVVDIGVRSTLNVMKWLKMIPGKIEEHKNVLVISGHFQYYGYVRTNHGGIIHSEKIPGEKISKGEIIARIHNLFGEEVEEIKMPLDGYIWAYNGGGGLGQGGFHAVNTGNNVAYVFTPRKE